MVASLLVATSAFAQDNAQNSQKCKPQPQKCGVSCDDQYPQLVAAYNAPARVDVRSCWDFYVTGTFIYWQPIQENMELAVSTNLSSATPLIPTNGTTNQGSVVNLSTSYEPGFKVGLGMNYDYDSWDTYAEYTWFHNTNSSSVAVTTPGALFPMRNHPRILVEESPVFTDISGSWGLKMDFADLSLARAYWVGTRLSFRPFVGARGAWIRQKQTVTGTTATQTDVVSNHSTSWGVGARAGLETNWMMGCGFRFFGNGSADLLFTRYSLRNKEYFSTTSTELLEDVLSTTQSKVNAIRPHMDLELGFAWGSYFDNNNWHFDLSAGYGFQVFWNQNMFRNFTDNAVQSVATSNLPNGDLFVHGLNLVLRLDF